jgi:hypothetical protein
MPAAGQPFIVSNTCVVSFPMVRALSSIEGVKAAAQFRLAMQRKVYTLSINTQAQTP